MGMFHGRGGRVRWLNSGYSDILHITNWTFDAVADTVETTAMSDANNWKTYLAGFKSWTASVDYNVTSDALNPGLDGSDLGYSGSDTGSDIGCFLNLMFEGSDATTRAHGVLVGQAIMNGLSIAEPVDGIVTATVSFQGTNEAHWSDAWHI